MNEIRENNFSYYVKPYIDEDNRKRQTIEFVPNNISFSKKIGGTIYEVSAQFDTEANQTMLQQFKKIILSADL